METNGDNIDYLLLDSIEGNNRLLETKKDLEIQRKEWKVKEEKAKKDAAQMQKKASFYESKRRNIEKVLKSINDALNDGNGSDWPDAETPKERSEKFKNYKGVYCKNCNKGKNGKNCFCFAWT